MEKKEATGAAAAAAGALEEKLCSPDGCSEQEADESRPLFVLSAESPSLDKPGDDLGHQGSVPTKESLFLECDAVPETPCEKAEEAALLDEGLSLRLTISQAVEQAECSAVGEAVPQNDPHVTGEPALVGSGKLEQGPRDNPNEPALEVQSKSRRINPGMMLKQSDSEPPPEQGSSQLQRRTGSFPGEILHARVPPGRNLCPPSRTPIQGGSNQGVPSEGRLL